MVCVTAQRQCERLIRAGSGIACGGALSVVHVAPVDQPLLYGESVANDSLALDFLYRAARAFNADMIVEHNDKPLDAITALAERIGAQCVVLGISAAGTARSFSEALAARLPGVRVHTEL
jgi:K+-sensing histidine kinase KdpD